MNDLLLGKICCLIAFLWLHEKIVVFFHASAHRGCLQEGAYKLGKLLHAGQSDDSSAPG